MASSKTDVTRRHARLIIAFAVAPLAPVLLYYCFVLPKPVVLFVGAALSYCAEILVGFPLFLRALRLNYLTQNACIVGGFVSGTAYSIVATILFLIESWSGALTG